MKPWRYVLHHTIYAGRWVATLECGHTITRLHSQAVPEKTRCHDCFITQRDAAGNALDGTETGEEFRKRVDRMTKPVTQMKAIDDDWN